MADSLFETVKLLDPDIAKVYFDLTKDDPKAVLDEKGVNALLEQAVGADEKITPKELDALIAIFKGPAPALTDKAKELLKTAFASKITMHSLGKGSGKVLSKDEDLTEIYKAIDVAGLQVNFTSPKTGLAYNASGYRAVKQLIKTRQVMVLAVQDKGQVWDRGEVGAFYDRTLPLPVVFLFDKPTNAAQRQSLIVHELTHTIQDWNDIEKQLKYTETDATIAGGLIARATGLKPHKDDPFVAAVEMVASGAAKPGDKTWLKAYEDAADALAKIPHYAAQIKADPTANMLNDDKIKDQKAKLLDIIQKLDKAPSAPAPAAPRP